MALLRIENARLRLLQVVQNPEHSSFFPALIQITEWQKQSGDGALSLEQSLVLVDLLLTAVSQKVTIPVEAKVISQTVEEKTLSADDTDVPATKNDNALTRSRKRKMTAAERGIKLWRSWGAGSEIEMVVSERETPAGLPVVCAQRLGREKSTLHLRSHQPLLNAQFLGGTEPYTLILSPMNVSTHATASMPYVYRVFFQDAKRWWGLITMVCQLASGQREAFTFFRETRSLTQCISESYHRRMERVIRDQVAEYNENIKVAAALRAKISPQTMEDTNPAATSSDSASTASKKRQTTAAELNPQAMEDTNPAATSSDSASTASKERQTTAAEEPGARWRGSCTGGIELLVSERKTPTGLPVAIARRRFKKSADVDGCGVFQSVLHLRSRQPLVNVQFIGRARRLFLTLSPMALSAYATESLPYVYLARFQDDEVWRGLLAMVCQFASGEQDTFEFFCETRSLSNSARERYDQRMMRFISDQMAEHNENVKVAAELVASTNGRLKALVQAAAEQQQPQ